MDTATSNTAMFAEKKEQKNCVKNIQKRGLKEKNPNKKQTYNNE